MTAPDRAARPAAERADAHTCLEFESYRYHDLLPRLRAALQGDFDGSAVVGALQAALRDLDDELAGRTPVGTGRREYAAIDAQQLLAFLEGAARPAAEGADDPEGALIDLLTDFAFDMAKVGVTFPEGSLYTLRKSILVLVAARPAPAAATPPAPEGAGDALARYAEALLAHEVAEEAWRADVLDWPLKRAAWAAQRAEWDALKALQLAVRAARPTPRAAGGEGS